MHVLSDDYKGLLKDADTEKANGIYVKGDENDSGVRAGIRAAGKMT